MSKFFIVAVLALGLSGCATTQWQKYGITQQEADQDHHACTQEAAQYNSAGFSHVSSPLYDACMAAKGYSPKP